MEVWLQIVHQTASRLVAYWKGPFALEDTEEVSVIKGDLLLDC